MTYEFSHQLPGSYLVSACIQDPYEVLCSPFSDSLCSLDLSFSVDMVIVGGSLVCSRWLEHGGAHLESPIVRGEVTGVYSGLPGNAASRIRPRLVT